MQPIGASFAQPRPEGGAEQDGERRRGRRNRRDRGDRGDRGDRHDGQRHEGPRQDGPRQDGPRQEGSRHEGPRREGQQRPDGQRNDRPRREVPVSEDQLREKQLREGRLRAAEAEQAAAAEASPFARIAAAPVAAAAMAPVFEPQRETRAFEPPREAPVIAEAPPIAVERRPEPRIPAPPPVNVDDALRDSGLVMIETSRDKVRADAPVDEAPVPRARRERRPPPSDLETPLQQVETRKSDGGPTPQ